MKNIFNREEKNYAASILKDPFSSTANMKSLFIHAEPEWRGSGWEYRGSIKFKNGDTTGEQSFKEDSLKALLIAMQAFVETLDKR